MGVRSGCVGERGGGGGFKSSVWHAAGFLSNFVINPG